MSGAALEQTRVILVEMRRMLREIVREVVSSQPDLEVVDEDDDASLATIRASGACVVITQRGEPAGERIARFLGTRPQVRVLALSSDGATAPSTSFSRGSGCSTRSQRRCGSPRSGIPLSKTNLMHESLA